MENVRSIEKINGLYASIDWIEFTIMAKVDIYANRQLVDYWLEYIGLVVEEFDEQARGGYGYSKSCKHFEQNIFVYYAGADDMGIHIRVSGSAIGYLFKSIKASYKVSIESACIPFVVSDGYIYDMGQEDFIDVVYILINKVLNVGHFTRIDLAIDDIGANYYSVDKVAMLAKNGQIVSRFKNYEYIDNSTLSHERKGITVYFGSRQSDVFLRVYEKGLEQGVELPWTRWELEIKHEKADEVAKMLLDSKNIGATSLGILSNYIRIVQRDNTRKTRCSTDSVWSSFIYGTDKLKILLRRYEKTVDDKMRWIEHQCMPTIAGLIVANGGDLSFIRDNMEMHYDRLSGRDKMMYQMALERCSCNAD